MSSATASTESRLGISAVNVPIVVGVVNSIPMSNSPITSLNFTNI